MICDPVACDSCGTRASQYEESSPPPASSTMVGELPGMTWKASRCPLLVIICNSAAGAAGAAFGAAELSHPATAAITATGRTRARAARRNREVFCVVMKMSFHGYWILLNPASPPVEWGVTPTLARGTSDDWVR